MKLITARQAWHDSTHAVVRSGLSGLEGRAMLGVAVQTTNRGVTADHAVHCAFAGIIQSVIVQLHPQLRAFGDWMYSSLECPNMMVATEKLIFDAAIYNSKRMTKAKQEKAKVFAKGVLHRYKKMNQGGYHSAPDPLLKPAAFRSWLWSEHNLSLASSAWEREWGEFEASCFGACELIDKMALAPITAKLRDICLPERNQAY